MNENLARLSVLIGVIATHAMVGSMAFYFNFLPYRYSELKRHNAELTRGIFDLMMPLAFAAMFSVFYLGAFIEEKTKPRIALFIGGLCVLSSVGFLSLSKHIIIDYCLMALYGIGNGINYLASIPTLIYHYQENNHRLVIGGAMSGFALGAFFCIIPNMVMNPNGIRQHINYLGDGDLIYPLYITNRMLMFQLVFLGVTIIFCALSVICTCDYNKDRQSVLVDMPIDVTRTTIDVNKKLEVPFRRQDVQSADSFYVITVCRLCFALKSYGVLIVIALSCFTPFFCLFTFYDFGTHYLINENILVWSAFFFVFMCGIGRLCIGVVINIFTKRYKIIMYITLGAQLLLGSLFYFAVQWSWGYMIVLMLIGFTYGSLTVLIPLQLLFFYAEDRFLYMYSLQSISQAIIAILCVPCIKILSTALTDYGTLHMAVYLIAAGGNIIAVIAVFCTKDEQVIESGY